MGCIQSKKLIKIKTTSPNNDSKTGSNNIAIHNTRKDTTNNNENHNSYNNNNNDKKDNNSKNEDKMIHSISQNFKIKTQLNDNQSKSNHSQKNSSINNRSMSNSDEENSKIFKLVSNSKSNLINKDLKFQDKYLIVSEENCETYFQTYKIKLIEEKLSKEEYLSMIKIEKEIFGEFASDKKVAEEVSLLSKLDSKYIIKVYECFISNKRYYLITDYCEYGSLNEKLRKGNMYNESQIRYVVIQLFKAVKYLNSKNFLHIEISPEKILIYNITKDSNGEELYNIKLLDFFYPSSNNLVFDNKPSYFCYIAPEVLEQKYSPTCDIWSIGIIIFQMFFGELPYKGDNDFKEYVKNIKKIYSNCDNISYEFRDILDKMLNKNASRRITIDECLLHPWIHKQNTEIIFEEDEIIKKPYLRAKTRQSRDDKKHKKSYKNGKLNFDSNKYAYFSENNSYKTNIIEKTFHRNSSSILADSFNSINNDYTLKILNKKNEMNITNESTKEKIYLNSSNHLKNFHMRRKTNSIFNINKSKKNLHLNVKRVSSISADKNNEKKDKNKYSPLIEKTIEYIKYYININYHKKKEIEKITKIFHELDTQKNNYLLYNKVYFACASYKDNKKISLDSFNDYDINNVNNYKKYTKEEFINELIDEKSKYINENLKNVFDIIKQPNVDEIIKIYKNQEIIEEYKKYNNYIKEIIKIIKENNIKTNYVYNEFKTILDNSIRKLYKTNISNKMLKLQNKERVGRTYTKKIIKDRNAKTKIYVNRSNTYLKEENQENSFNQNNNINIVNKINLSGNNIGNFEMPVFNPENFLKLLKK